LTTAAARGNPRIERRTQAQRRAESEHRILQAAAELFGEQGYVDTTMEQIGVRAGFSAALIARKFGSKPGVIEALLQAIRRNTSAAIDPDGDRDVVDVVRSYVRLIAAGNVWSRALYVLMAESVGPLRDKAELFAKHNRSFIATLAAGIARAQRDGRAKADVKPRPLATELVARIRGVTLLWLIDPTVDFAGMTARLIDDLQRTLAADAPVRRKTERALAVAR
jgi:AcrR family transcriptional regulator